MDYRLRRHDGEFRWIQDDGCPRYNLNGEFVGYIGYCLDITERKLAEAALRESEDNLRQAQRAAKIGHWVFDFKTGNITWSEELYRIFGLEEGSHIPDAAAYAGFIYPDDAYFGTPECLERRSV